MKRMSLSLGLRLPVCLFLAITKGVVVRGQTAGPNAVAKVKGQAMLDCPVSILVISYWIHTPDGTNNPFVIAIGCSVIGNNAAHYRTEQPGGNICRLIITNATMQQAGVYLCTDWALTVYRSLVTVIDPVASVVVYNQSEVVADDQLNISCSINYNGPASPAPSLRPSPYWITSPGQIYTSTTYHPSRNIVTLMATVTVQKYTFPIFQCSAVFEIAGSTIGYNGTAPADSFTTQQNFGNTAELDVQYYVSSPNIAKSTLVACGTIVLTCNSLGNPPPKYKWFSWNKGVIDFISEEQNLILAEGNQSYTCEAYNTIRNVTHTASTNYTVSDRVYSSYCNTQAPVESQALVTIVFAVVLGGYGLCNMIATIVFLAYYNRESNSVRDDNDTSTFKNKEKVNEMCPLFQRMLLCMNDAKEDAGCKFLWLVLFILISIFIGTIAFPIAVLLVNCSKKNKDLKGTRRNVSVRPIQADDIGNLESETPTVVTYEELHPTANQEQPEVYTSLTFIRNEYETVIGQSDTNS